MVVTLALPWQHVLALDARYNAYRTPNNSQFRTQYIRRRSQLLREAAKTVDPTFRKKYLKIRSQLLAHRYGQISEASSLRSASVRGSVLHLDRTESTMEEKVEVQTNRFSSDVVPTNQADASRAMVGGKSVGENYAFVGMHHIFDEHIGCPATSIKFANDEKNLLAYSSMDGTISICQLVPKPTVLVTLKGHNDGVTDFSWSLSNDLIVSVSLDATLRLWQSQSGSCIRAITSSVVNMKECAIHCCLFQPINNNMVVLGNSSGQIAVVNISTGKTRKGANGKLSGAVLSMSFDSSGKVLWAGDDQGIIYSFSFDLSTGQLRKAHQMVIHAGRPLTSIQARAWISREARDPSVLVNIAADVLCLYRVVDDRGLLQFKKSFPIKHSQHLIRSMFCPLMSFRQGACVVTGSEDMSVCFFDIESSSKICVNRLQGHSAVVLAVSFNHDESMLASCDTEGMVIIWKREE
uniref:WD repeat-containing protein 13-like n=1 Tax=Ciona intestinalis TaxID=7719 RepID=A0A1W5BFR1_CIOIN|nr:WD repeat-containing protein 13-like [Ciona intestinalis]|eukprot:XP_018669266.1 WD repeat-containing protein 13-like [Ciona intestinalis]